MSEPRCKQSLYYDKRRDALQDRTIPLKHKAHNKMPYTSVAASGIHVRSEEVVNDEPAPVRLVVANTVVIVISLEFLQLVPLTSGTSAGSAKVISTHYKSLVSRALQSCSEPRDIRYKEQLRAGQA